MKILLFLLLIAFLPTTAYAGEFSTSYNTTYEILPTNETLVEQKIKITNQEKDVIATDYALIIRQLSITDVQVKGGDKDITLDVEQDSDKTVIKANFSEFAIGQFKSKDFTITYKTKDIAGVVGDVTNISIPKIQNLDSVDEYNIKLIIPKSVGPMIYVSPNPLSQEENDLTTTFYFNKVILNNIGIDAAFGKKQLLNFKLSYILQNDSVFAKNMQIALPPYLKDRQTVSFKELDPKPYNVTTDADGNQLAQYRLGPKQTLNITAVGNAEVFGKQIVPSFGGNFKEIPTNLSKIYTQEALYWEVNNPKIIEIANKLKDENKSVSENAQAIYDYVGQTLKYDFNLVRNEYIERNGALKALTTDSSWACMEFTDTFIAIARAMGIPARELNGYAYSGENASKPISIGFKSGDVLHAWPEFYDPKFGWVAIDPTWGSTSGLDYFTRLDTNHFVFVRKGIDSVYPLPAGAYKLDGSEKQVEVEFSLNESFTTSKVKLLRYNTVLINPLRLLKKEKPFFFVNTGNRTITLNGTDLPPFAHKKIYVKQTDLDSLDDISIENSKTYKYVFGDIRQSITFYIIAFVLALVPCTILFVLITHLKDLRTLISRRLHHLRGLDQ